MMRETCRLDGNVGIRERICRRRSCKRSYISLRVRGALDDSGKLVSKACKPDSESQCEQLVGPK